MGGTDLGLSDADAHRVKAEMGAGIDAIVPRRGTTQAEAARLLGPSQPDVYRPFKGDLREHSLELLFRMIAVLG